MNSFQAAVQAFRARQMPQAEQLCRQALAENPNHAPALNLLGAIAGSAASIAAASITGRKSRANPVKTAASSAAGSLATDLAGPLAGRFVRNLIGGLMR